jgi:hypothetical protein
LPVFQHHSPDLNYAWWEGAEKKYEQFLTLAEAGIDFPGGNYELVLAGKMWHIYIDGQLLLDGWKPAEHLYDESPHRELPVKLTGKHHLRI